MIGIGEEISIFLQAFLTGSIVFFSYNCIRVIRRIVKHNLFFVSVEDFLFWGSTSIYLFVEMYRTSDGRIRWFFVIGAVVGLLAMYGVTVPFRKLYRKFQKRMDRKMDRKDKKVID